jgi:Asp/Glu/hydantoin racemase
MTRIYWLNPVGTDDYDAVMVETLQRELGPDTEVVVESLSEGPCHLEYHYYGALVLPESIRRLQEAERDGFDAAVMGCFYDPGLKEIREVISEMPVVFPAETCTYLAATMGDRFSILVGRQKWIPSMRDSVERYGLAGKLASFVPLGLGVQDFQRDHDVTRSRMIAAGRKAIEQDHAEVLILGCTMEFGFAMELQALLGVPVLDATVTPLKFAEFKADLRRRYGWSHSKAGAYESPPELEIREWSLPWS